MEVERESSAHRISDPAISVCRRLTKAREYIRVIMGEVWFGSITKEVTAEMGLFAVVNTEHGFGIWRRKRNLSKVEKVSFFFITNGDANKLHDFCLLSLCPLPL